MLAGPGVIGLDVALPISHRLLKGDVVEDYRWLGECWVQMLSNLGLPARTLAIEEARFLTKSDAHQEDLELACFGTYSPYEVVVGRRKVVGVSQVRRKGGVLFSCALHLDLSPSDLASHLPIPARRRSNLKTAIQERAASLAELGVKVSEPDRAMEAFRLALRDRLGVILRRGTWAPSEVEATAS